AVEPLDRALCHATHPYFPLLPASSVPIAEIAPYRTLDARAPQAGSGNHGRRSGPVGLVTASPRVAGGADRVAQETGREDRPVTIGREDARTAHSRRDAGCPGV